MFITCSHTALEVSQYVWPDRARLMFSLCLETMYEISIYTGDVLQGGTRASVSIALAGEWDYTQPLTMSAPDR